MTDFDVKSATIKAKVISVQTDYRGIPKMIVLIRDMSYTVEDSGHTIKTGKVKCDRFNYMVKFDVTGRSGLENFALKAKHLACGDIIKFSIECYSKDEYHFTSLEYEKEKQGVYMHSLSSLIKEFGQNE